MSPRHATTYSEVPDATDTLLVVEFLPTAEPRLQKIRLHQDEDEVSSKLKLFCREAWPTSPELFTSTILAVQSRNHCSVGNPNEIRQSHHSVSVKARCIRQDTHMSSSSRHPEMLRKGKKWCLVAESQQADRRPFQ